VQGLVELAEHLKIGSKASDPAIASAVDFALEGLYAQKKISRSDDRGYHAAEQQQRRPAARAAERDIEEGLPLPGGKKKYYN
jgi:magnesium chelatase subunit I